MEPPPQFDESTFLPGGSRAQTVVAQWGHLPKCDPRMGRSHASRGRRRACPGAARAPQTLGSFYQGQHAARWRAGRNWLRNRLHNGYGGSDRRHAWGPASSAPGGRATVQHNRARPRREVADVQLRLGRDGRRYGRGARANGHGADGRRPYGQWLHGRQLQCAVGQSGASRAAEHQRQVRSQRATSQGRHRRARSPQHQLRAAVA